MPAHLDEMNLLRKRKLRRHLDELSAYLQTSYLSQNTIPNETALAVLKTVRFWKVRTSHPSTPGHFGPSWCFRANG